MTEDKPMVEVTCNGPYVIHNFSVIWNSNGKAIETEQTAALCRCGESKNKPFCDGTHAKIGFIAKKHPDRLPDKLEDYQSKEIAIHDNRGVCAHAGICSESLVSVFKNGMKPWIDQNAGDPKEIAAVCRLCPSGALSYTINGKLHKDYEREPRITITKNGPLKFAGSPEFRDPDDNKPESSEHFTLCRCGESKNKPFCDGSHDSCGFKDDKN